MRARIEIRDLKRRLAESKNEYEHKIIELEKKNSIAETVVEEQKALLTKSESNMEYLFKQNKDLQDKLSATEKELKSKLEDLEERLLEAEHDRNEMQEARSVLAEQNDDFASQLEYLEMESDSKINAANDQLQNVMEMLRHESKLRTELQNKVSELESELSQKKRQQTERFNNDHDSILKQFKEQVVYINQLKSSNEEMLKEINYLRLTKENAERLKEEKLSLVNQLQNTNHLREKLAEAELELSRLLAEKKRWSEFLQKDDCAGYDSPYALSKSLARERLDLAVAMERLGGEAATQKGMRVYIAQLEKDLSEVRQEVTELKLKYESTMKTQKRNEKTRDLLQKEIQCLREQLNTYALEEEEMHSNFDRVKTERITQLERLLDSFKSRISELEAELASSLQGAAHDGPTLSKGLFSPEVLEKVEKLQGGLLLEKELASVTEQASILENAIGRGVCDTTNVRILQMSDNPQSRDYKIRKDMLDALKVENDHLKRQLRSEIGENELTPKSCLKPLQLQFEDAQRQIEEKEKRIARLKEVYSAKAQEYREAVFSLVGYKVDFQEGRVKLVSTYANKDDPSFLFTSGPNDEGTMQLTGGSVERLRVLQRARQYYIEEKGSVPAFLASVTLTGWERVAGSRVD
ncbi:Mitotic spindle assembly checkpoint protein MAD1 [Phlyctochytrium planicorne]|nr:Mitotic spindle assembly checkpoint protein MAD1 [Phlyctochytrium planicorne]